MSHSSAHTMYYVAIVCPPELNDKILQFKYWMKDQFGCIVALKSPAHITLVPPFWSKQADQSRLLQALASFSSDVAELDIQLEGFSHFGRKVLFASVHKYAEMERLKKQVEAHFIQSFDNIRRDDRPFHPHITIANRDLKPGDFLSAWKYFSEKKFLESFRVKTISLLKLDNGKWNIIGEKNW